MSVWPTSRAGPACLFSPDDPCLPFLLPPPVSDRHLCQGSAAQSFHVLACDRKDCQFDHPHIHSQVMDLCCLDAIPAAFVRAVALFGPLHVLIRNGAVSHFCKPLEALTVAEWDTVLHTNLRGAALCCQAFLATNAGAGYGRIINMAPPRAAADAASRSMPSARAGPHRRCRRTFRRGPCSASLGAGGTPGRRCGPVSF